MAYAQNGRGFTPGSPRGQSVPATAGAAHDEFTTRSPDRPSRYDLKDIARRAMMQHGLAPEFSPAAIAEAEAIDGPPRETAPSVRDAARASVGVDRQRRFSRSRSALGRRKPLANGAITIFVAIADVDATVPDGWAINAHARINTTSVYTAAGIFRCCPRGCRRTSLRSTNANRASRSWSR